MYEQKKKVAEQIKNLHVYLGHIQDRDTTEVVEINWALATQSIKGNNSHDE